jgi:RNA recognition motif-containing protein
MLGAAGQIVDVHLPLDRATGRPRGFAFVEFATEEESAKAIAEFDGKELGGRPLRINEAQERAPRPPSFRPSYNSGPSGGGGGGGWSGGGGGGGGGREAPSRPKGSRRGMRRKKRSL